LIENAEHFAWIDLDRSRFWKRMQPLYCNMLVYWMVEMNYYTSETADSWDTGSLSVCGCLSVRVNAPCMAGWLVMKELTSDSIRLAAVTTCM